MNFDPNRDPNIAKILYDDTIIKEEPQDFDDSIPITPYEPPEPPRFPSSVEKLETYEKPIIETIYTTAKEIHEREARGQKSSYQAKIPSALIYMPRSYASPLTISAFNSLHPFQATTENAKKVTVEANPKSHVPLSVQKFGYRIGADIGQVQSRDPRLQKRPIELPPRRRETTSLETPPTVRLNLASNIQPPVEKKDAETQTTLNDGTLRLELTSNELKDLPRNKIELLLQFKQAFNINDDLSLNAIMERLMHRSANQNYKNYRDSRSSSRSSSGYRDLDRDRSESKDHRSPEPKQPKYYYTPPP